MSPMRHHLRTHLAETRQPTWLASSDPAAAAIDRTPTAREDLGGLLLQLQRSLGNRYVQQMVGHARAMRTMDDPGVVPMIQTKLVLGSADDRYEREADRVARQITCRTASHRAAGETPSAAADSAYLNLEASVNRASSSGEPLADSVAAPMEEAFGVDFRRVRMHTDVGSDDLCRWIGARAFTVGDHIFFRRGEQPSGGTSGRHLLAHELTHVVQQRGIAPPGGDANGHAGAARTSSAPGGIIQAFWVLRNEKYYWRTAHDRQRFFRLPNVTYANRKHSGPVFVELWEMPESKLNIEPVGLREGRRQKLKGATVSALMRIRRTGIGAALLRNLVARSPHRTVIKPMWTGPLPKTTYHADGHSEVAFEPKKIYDAMDWYLSREDRAEVDWRRMPIDVVLFHELVHAYHNAYGSAASGKIRAEAIDPVDRGVRRDEYQAVGLPPYQNELFTENLYRGATGRPPRTTYRVPFKPGVELPRHSSQETDEGLSSEGSSQEPTMAREEDD